MVLDSYKFFDTS